MRFGWQTSQEQCPFNRQFARDVKEPRFQARAAIGKKDAIVLAVEIPATSEDDFRAAFKGSAMKRAKSTGIKRNATVVVGNRGPGAT